MKYKFSVTADSLEDGDRHKIFVHAEETYAALTDAQAFIRNKLKYAEISEESRKLLEQLREIVSIDCMEL